MRKPDLLPIETPRASCVRAALGRLIASSAFNHSPQLGRFLTFVVEEALAGRSHRLKAYTIATDGLGRDGDFDPQTDPIVRVEAGRVRRALESYYANEGRLDPVLIEIPVGQYAPVFSENIVQRAPSSGIRAVVQRLSGSLTNRARTIILMVLIAVIVSLSLDLFFMGRMKSTISEMISRSAAPTDATGATRR